ncbi:hypothetical protein M408DRAFT_144618 [Serendipita vermifera MAFF 305830]|uniref:Extracellular membrane protein CFEM domain-containing protein n=1 Tax=Serendipita vermifera MAFF 305830 TaxID=933852 RepID=A0A0C3B9V1_SERVB|nr:hypothetical protein M408DRAFT_144618 [Serendipita vermifera MAFF 305830]
MHISYAVWTIVAFVVGEAYGMKQEDLHNLLKRQNLETLQQCTNTCNSFSTQSNQCSSLISNTSAYSQCFCSGSVAQTVVDCVNCGIVVSSSQSDVDLVQYVYNTYTNACNMLGSPVAIAITTQPAVTFPCTLNLSSNPSGVTPNTNTPNTNTALFSTTSGSATRTSTGVTSTPTGITLPTNLSIDPAQASLLSSLLGAISAV